MYIYRLNILLAWLLLCSCAVGPTHPTLNSSNMPDAIRIKEFFFNIDIQSNYKISPDGKKIAWLGKKDKRRTIFFKTIGRDNKHHFDHGHFKTIYHIHQFYWARDSRHILYPLTEDDSQQTHIFRVDTENYGHYPKDLTPWENFGADICRIPRSDREHILVCKRAADETVVMTSTIDLVKINILTGNEELIAKNPGNVLNWIVDAEGNLCGRILITSIEKRALEAIDSATGKWNQMLAWSIDESVYFKGFTPENKGMYLLSNVGRDRLSLTRLDLTNRKEEVLFEDPDVDLENVLISPAGRKPVAAFSYPDYQKLHLLNSNYKDLVDAFRSHDRTGISFYSADDTESRITVLTYSDKNSAWYLYDRDSGEKELLSKTFTEEFAARLSPMKPVSIKSRDGIKLHGYLTLPQGTAGRHLPMVLYVHGGPWSRDYWGYSRTVQFLANRGYAVLQVNFRGSIGFGRSHKEAAKGEFAGKMHTDLIDGVNWAIREGIADPEKISIFGFSYGGYAALVGLAFTPDVFACGISVNGPSNLITFIESKDVSKDDYKIWYSWHNYVGNPADPDDNAQMKARSPYFKVDQIIKPLMIVQGAKDRRVPRSESDQMVKALKKANKEVKYKVFSRESHYIAYWKNRFRLYQDIETFLGKHLGGRKISMDAL